MIINLRYMCSHKEILYPFDNPNTPKLDQEFIIWIVHLEEKHSRGRGYKMTEKGAEAKFSNL